MKFRIVVGAFLGLAVQLSSAQGPEEISLDLMSGKLTAPFLLSNSCLVQTVDTDLSGGGRAAFTFTITNAGHYAVLALVRTSPTEGNAFCVNIDAEPDASMVWEIPRYDGFTNRFVSWPGSGSASVLSGQPKFFGLNEGEHQLIIRGKSAHTAIQRLLLVRRPPPPVGLRVIGVSLNNENPPPRLRRRAG